MDKAIAVVIPTFNRIELTNRAVNSVVSTRPDLVEIIVIDDCGSEPYQSDSESNSSSIPIRVLRTPSNGGPGLARKLAVEQFRGTAVAFLDSDDVFESYWLDAGLHAILNVGGETGGAIIVAGNAQNGTAINRICIRCLKSIPEPLKITFCRITAIMFNPFYTSAIIASKELCIFNDSLRYCEDYYMNAMAIFRAKKIVITPLVACSIARKPGSSGGLTSMKFKMFTGEMGVRWAMLRSQHIPLIYKCLVPFGMLYQVTRTGAKWFIHNLRPVM